MQNKLLVSLVILIFAFLTSAGLKRFIDIIFSSLKGKIARERVLSRTRTIRSVLKSVISGIIFFIAILIILSHFEVNIVPILTGAGILGLAISFGSQSLVKDILSGVFLIAEDHFNIGDNVKIGEYEGEVYKLTLRHTILRDKNGNLIYILNSEIKTVTRYKKS